MMTSELAALTIDDEQGARTRFHRDFLAVKTNGPTSQSATCLLCLDGVLYTTESGSAEVWAVNHAGQHVRQLLAAGWRPSA